MGCKHFRRTAEDKRGTSGGLFKDYELQKVQVLSAAIVEMDVLSLNYWLSKFMMEVAEKSGERHPPKSEYATICALKRYLEALNPLDANDKRYRYSVI